MADLNLSPGKGEHDTAPAAGFPLTLVKGSSRPGEPRWLTDLRLRALDRFDHLPWPTPQEEEWRRTDLTEVDFGRFAALVPDRETYSGAGGGGEQPASGQGGAATPQGRLSGSVRFAAGVCKGVSLSPELEARGVRLATLADLGGSGDEESPAWQSFRRTLEEGLAGLDNRFLAWHYASMSHGVFLYVPPFVEVSEPFLIELAEENAGAASAPHLAVVLDRGARATVLLRTIGGPEGAGTPELPPSPAGVPGPRGPNRWRSLVNLGIDLVVGDAGGLEFYHLQDLPLDILTLSHGTARVARDAHLLSFEAALGSGLLKSRLECSLDGPGSEAFLNGVYLSRERQHMDVRTVQRHRAPSATSRAFYKGALKDRSRAIYQGLIEVAPVAAKTDAFLTDRNLILNDGARADSIPSLRIDTNDVKCSHGSTTGKIDELQLFYLMSRGLARGQAEQMLILGYFEELLAPAPERFAEELRGLIADRVSAGPPRSSGESSTPSAGESSTRSSGESSTPSAGESEREGTDARG